MLIYLGIKALRRDFIYWIPLEEGLWNLVVSFLIRIVVKVVVDFTGCVHFRHPYEVSNFEEGLNKS
jgi:hypothetical protein